MPACETCRIRKTRCDREAPCGACRISQFECTPGSRQSRVPRKTDLALRQNTNASSVIKPKPTAVASASPAQVQLGASTPSPTVRRNSSDLSELPSVSLVDAESVECESEPSLHAHSIAARDLLVQTLGTHSHVRDNPKMVAALSSLRQIVETDKAQRARKTPKLAGLGSPRQTIYELTLPPTEVALDILRQTKERQTFTLSPPLALVSHDQFTELCRTVFFRTEEYPTSTAVIVHGILENLLQEFKWADKEPGRRQWYEQWARQCRTNLEISISNLDILLPACMESAQALLIAASYCMEIAQASLCKRFVTHGCMMVQSLGWHRSTSIHADSEPVRRLKLVVFWMLYVIDKNLSLRLGQASLMRDEDIDLPFPSADPSLPLASRSRIKMWADSARVMDLVYQRLYSPGALKQTDAARFQAVQHLLQRVEGIRPETTDRDDFSQLIKDPDFAHASFLRAGSELLLRSDEITYRALLCMIYRATPTSAHATYDPAVECIKHARAALDSHQSCTSVFKSQDELWAIYLHWTILNTPFVPFTTLFSHVLTTHDRVDLERLQQFAESMSDCPTSPAAQKVSRLASIFVRVATVYVESREKEEEARRAHIASQKSAMSGAQHQPPGTSYLQTPAYAMPAWAPFNPFLDALGFAEPSSVANVDGMTDANANLENWFNGNQHIMGLLEDDLSYLDPDILPF